MLRRSMYVCCILGFLLRTAGADEALQPAKLTAHKEAVNAVAFSPDSSTLATAGSDGKVLLWDVERQTPRMILPHRKSVQAIAWSPESILAVAVEQGVVLWDLKAEARLGSVPKQGERFAKQGLVTSLAFSPAGKKVVIGTNAGVVAMANTNSRTITDSKRHYSWDVFAVDITADGTHIAAGGSGSSELGGVALWNLTAKTDGPHEYFPHRQTVRCLQFSPDGTTLATGALDGRLLLLDLAEKRRRRESTLARPAHTGGVYALAYSPDGTVIATGGNDKLVRLWNTEKLELILTLAAHTEKVKSVAISPDGKWLASGGGDPWAALWRLEDQFGPVQPEESVAKDESEE